MNRLSSVGADGTFRGVVLLSSLVLGLVAGCVPKRDLPPEEIQKLTSLEHVMHVNATIADPQFAKIGKSAYTDEDWAAFTDVGNRLQVTGKKSKEFSKGTEFDALADELGTHGAALATAASTKDAAAASAALGKIKATCKTCHTKFR